jgi:hypothetical protein
VRALNQKEIEYEWRDIHNGDPIWKDELRTLTNGKSQRAFKRVLWESAGRQPRQIPKSPSNATNKSPNFVVKSSIRAKSLSQNDREAH